MSVWEYLGIDPEDPVEKWAFAKRLAEGPQCPGVGKCQADDLFDSAWKQREYCVKCWEDALNKGEVTIKCAE